MSRFPEQMYKQYWMDKWVSRFDPIFSKSEFKRDPDDRKYLEPYYLHYAKFFIEKIDRSVGIQEFAKTVALIEGMGDRPLGYKQTLTETVIVDIHIGVSMDGERIRIRETGREIELKFDETTITLVNAGDESERWYPLDLFHQEVKGKIDTVR